MTYPGQSRFSSLVETITGTFIGYLVALASQLLIFPRFDLHPTFEQNLLIGAFFTLVSLVRGYFVRRFFNYLHQQGLL